MNLIEKLGGYSEAKKIKVAFDATHYCISRKSMIKVLPISLDDLPENLRSKYKAKILDDDDLVTQEQIDDALLEYRREHNIYEVGDLIAATDNSITKIYKILGIEYGDLYRIADKSFFQDGSFRHATDAEIKAGHRL